MSHYSCLVVIPPGYTGDIEEFVSMAMAPYDENRETGLTWVAEEGYGDEGGYWSNEQSFWDWWQIGGRWSGHFARDDYDPHKDPRNWETCDICGGTGQRGGPGSRFPNESPSVRDGKPYCNGCTHYFEHTGQVGVAVKWPTQWVNDTGNVARLGDVREYIVGEGMPYRVVHEGTAAVEHYNRDGEGYDGGPDSIFPRHEDDVRDVIRKLSDDCVVVVVDYHN